MGILTTIRQAIKNERGVALLSVYMSSALMASISAAAFSKAFMEQRQVEQQINQIQSYAAAEAGIQNAMAQIGQNAYTGFINANAISVSNFRGSDGSDVGGYDVQITYPDDADWVVVQSTATVNGETRMMEGRIFLDSNLSKYLLYMNTPSLGLGTNLVLGQSDGTNPEGVPQNPVERAATYHTGDLYYGGTNVHIYGDVHAQKRILGDPNSVIHGDAYVGNFRLNKDGTVGDDGITNGLQIRDGFNDDIDRNRDFKIDHRDHPDQHDLTKDGGGDAHKEEKLSPIDHGFYKKNSDPAVSSRGWGGTAKTRYVEFVPSTTGTGTTVVEYSDPKFENEKQRFDLAKKNTILYASGDLHVKGEISGRISVVATDDIFFDGDVKYKGQGSYVSPDHSAAFMAHDQLFFRPEKLEVSGIMYARKSNSNGSLAIDSNYDVNGRYNPGAKYSGRLRVFGNVIANGTANTSNYRTDRAYVYDPKIKYYRPPGIPVQPSLRQIREGTSAGAVTVTTSTPPPTTGAKPKTPVVKPTPKPAPPKVAPKKPAPPKVTPKKPAPPKVQPKKPAPPKVEKPTPKKPKVKKPPKKKAPKNKNPKKKKSKKKR